ncbi:RagB/SusD family nutrient uptake outer membrane protein [Arenibacter sp. BSSL-BM3]|uniref:RagB/SusD family nutrient uptake outer membrane protein n=1 Tax=Arenibacter arenosicollis TaxID=2762274 RepID=A0ABR7QKI7_9FLAO|nr:RagB/SusD family nutrient uptake outer membrane protein [Arenibacter arenosicollis]MBC8767707.1 RagB/SusD family nutrient uptake outer membrane protein [Arenibacter arenosicollis]
MKNLIKIFISLSVVLFMFSCSDDFLDKPNPNQLGESSFYQNEKQVTQAIVGVYGQLQEITASQWLYSEMITDNTTVHFDEGNRGNAPNIESFEYWQYNSGTGRMYDLYRDTYNTIGNINLTLSKLEGADIDANAAAKFEGELRFFRAYYYFLLTQYFGDVILITEPLTDPSAAFELERSPTSEVYAQIEDDLDIAVNSLPNTVPPSEAGRLTKGAALTLSGKFWLTRKDYTKAKAALDLVVSSDVYDLLPNYKDVFDPNNKNHKESIFEVQFQGGNDLGEHSGFIYNFYPQFTNGEVTGFPGVSGGGWNIPTLDIIGDYEDGDLRKAISVSEGYTNMNTGEFVAIPFIEKFRYEHSIQGRPDNNWPIYRYADVLLMLAEAINEQSGPNDEAYGYLNEVRDRADLDPVSGLSQDEFRTILLHERRIELAFENHRWFDLRRTLSAAELIALLTAHGELEKANPTTPRGSVGFSAGDYIFESHELLFPIPNREVVVNPGLTQNEGY